MIQTVNFISFVYLVEVEPYEEPFLNKMEIFNEVANILCIDLLFSFTDVINARQ